MRGQVFLVRNAVYDIVIRDADGRHLQLESFSDCIQA